MRLDIKKIKLNNVVYDLKDGRLPNVTTSDDGKFVMVDDGEFVVQTVPVLEGGDY